ncbi:hypothetical protein EON64_15150 [archaeon]|nr:MAG: hypothetical protein EON64_15150 [archaeon]
MYKVDPTYSGQAPQPSGDLAKVCDVLMQKMQAGFEEVLQAIKTYPLAHSAESAGLEARRRAMEELQRGGGEGGIYHHILSNNVLRERAFELFKNASLANDFMLYPAEYRHLFLDDLLAKLHK